MVNVTGWNELMNGSIFTAGVVLYQYAYGDWFITLLFLTIKAMLYLATKNVTINFVLSIFFLTLFATSLHPSLQITMGSVLLIEFGIIMYSAFSKK